MSSISKHRDLEEAVNWHDLSRREQEDLKEQMFKSIIIGDLEMVKNILSGYSGINMNYWMHNPRKDGDNPLHLAAFNGHLHIVEFLMENNLCHSNWNNRYKNKPLHRAAAKGRLNVVKYLVEKKNCDPMSKCNYEQTPLHMACQYNHLEVVRYLASLKNVNINAQNNQGQTPLHLACHNNCVEVVECLMDIEGINQDVKSNWELTPLERAKESGAREVVKYMTKSSTRVGKLDISLDQKESLFEATISGNLEMIKEIIGRLSGNMNGLRYNNKHRDNPLHLAARNGHIEVVKYLIESFYCESECRDIHYNTPLHRAARGGNLDVVKYLIEEQYCNSMCLCHWGRTPLHMACDHSHINVVKYLMNRVGVDKNAKNNRGLTPLDLAAQRGSVETVKYMIEEKKSYDSRAYFGYNTPLHLAAYRGNLEVVKYLVEEAGFDVNIEGYHSTTPLHSASYGEQMPVFKYLIETGKVKSSNDLTPLGIAAEHGTFEMVKYMVEDRNFPLQYSSSMYTPLHHAARGGKFESVKYFIESKGYDADCKGLKSRTPLHSACLTAMDYSNENYDKLKWGKYYTVEYLVYSCRANPSCQDDEGNTPLHTAVKSGEMSLVQLLVTQSQKELFVFDQLNRLPVSLAETGEHTAMLQYLKKAKQVYFDSSRKILKKCFSSLTKAVPASTNVDLYGEERFGTILEFRIPSSIRYHKIAGKFLKIDCNDSLDKTAGLIDERVAIICKLNHPNILQSFGLCLVPDEIMPVLLMENIKTSLRMNFNLSLSDMQRMNVLCGVASGLSYLHSQPTPFVHGHLTADNVLIDTMLIAKIGGFDIVCNPSIAKDTEYVAPEAQGSGTRSDPSIDVFSFGHLCLATLLQKEVQPLLPSQFLNEANEPSVRLEVDRRSIFLEETKQLLGPNHSIIDTIKRCLHNVPTQRPHIEQLDLYSSESSTTYTEARYSETGRALGADIVQPKPQDNKITLERAETKVKDLLKKEGTVKQKNLVVVITGLMEAGKTTLLHRLFGKQLPATYNSTSVAEQSWRCLTQHVIGIDEDNVLTLLDDHQDMFEMVAKVKYKVPHNISNVVKHREEIDSKESVSKDSIETVSDMEFVTQHKSNESAENVSESAGASNKTPVIQKDEKSHAFKEMVRIVRKNPEGVYGELELVHVIDTGGQPECLKIMPSLVHNAELILLVVDVSKPLEETAPTFHKDGKKYSKINSCICSKDIIRQLAQTMAAKFDSQNPRIITVGTHKDQVKGDDKSKSHLIKDKLEDLLKDMLPPSIRCVNEGNDCVFDTNLKDLDPKDSTIKRICKDIKESVRKRNRTVDVPPSYIMFEYEIAVHLNILKEREKRHIGVMKMDECYEVGQKLEMDKETVEDALQYFHENNILLLFKDCGLVFLDPKFLIYFVNSIVRFSYMFDGDGDGDGKATEHEDATRSMMEMRETEDEDAGEFTLPILTSSQIQYLRNGIITKELLENEYLANNFIEGIFEPGDAIQIFKSLYIIAEHLRRGDEEQDYIMMCLLRKSPTEYIPKQRSTLLSKVKPLIIEFGRLDNLEWEQWCSPSGSFGNTISCLISNFHWNIISNEQEHSLYQNIARVYATKQKLECTMIDMTNHFEIYPMKAEIDQKYITELRIEIVTAVRKVLSTMKIKLSIAEGLYCRSEPPMKVHLCFIDGTEQPLECKYSCKQHLESVWARDQQTSAGEPKTKQQTHAAEETTLTLENLHDVRSVLQPVIHRWKHIGLALRLHHSELKKIKKENSDDLDDCLTEMLSLWLNKNYNTERFGEPSWELLAKAVGDSAGGNDSALAEKIRKQ